MLDTVCAKCIPGASLELEAGQRELGRRSVLEAERELVAIGEMGEEDLAAAREWLAEHPPS